MAFGDFSTFAESLGQDENPTTTFVQKVRLTTPAVLAGDYRISWSYTWGLSSISNDFEAKIEQDDAIILYTHRQEPKDAATTQQQPGGGFAQVTLTAGIHTFDLDYRAVTGGTTSRIAQARLEFWSVV